MCIYFTINFLKYFTRNYCFAKLSLFKRERKILFLFLLIDQINEILAQLMPFCVIIDANLYYLNIEHFIFIKYICITSIILILEYCNNKEQTCIINRNMSVKGKKIIAKFGDEFVE